MVVACLFAGVGAWGAKVTVSPVTTYASELFGEGHGSPEYMKDDDGNPMAPMVVLTVPGDLGHNGSAEIKFMLDNGAMFDSNISGLMLDSDAGTDLADDGNAATTYDGDGDVDNDFVAAPGAIVSIVDGGTAGDDSITIKVEEATGAPARVAATADTPANAVAIGFVLPQLKNLNGLASAGGKTPVESIKLHITSRVVAGAFSDGKLSNAGPNPKAPGEAVMMSGDSLTVMIEPSGTNGAMKTIAIDDDDKGLTAFMSLKEKNKDGYVELATVTISTLQMSEEAMGAAAEKVMYYIDSDNTLTTGTTEVDDCPIDAALVRRINNAVERLGACATAASVGEVSQRLATVEAKFEAIDVMEEIGTVHRRVDQVVTNTASVAGELKSVVRSLDTITSHLLDRDR